MIKRTKFMKVIFDDRGTASKPGNLLTQYTSYTTAKLGYQS